MAATIYEIKLAELNDETDGWDLRDLLEMYIKAGEYKVDGPFSNQVAQT